MVHAPLLKIPGRKIISEVIHARTPIPSQEKIRFVTQIDSAPRAC
jgi:hypothetical protein